MAPEGSIVPVVVLIGKPDEGDIEKLPPIAPVRVTEMGRFGVAVVFVTLQRIVGL